MSDCNGKCTYCRKTDFPNLSDGKEVNVGYSYAYKVDCCGDRYIGAEEVKYLLNKARADAIDECIETIINTPTKVGTHLKEPQRVDSCLTMLADRQFEILGYLEQVKEQK